MFRGARQTGIRRSEQAAAASLANPKRRRCDR
jgi:hypothetical protein